MQTDEVALKIIHEQVNACLETVGTCTPQYASAARCQYFLDVVESTAVSIRTLIALLTRIDLESESRSIIARTIWAEAVRFHEMKGRDGKLLLGDNSLMSRESLEPDLKKIDPDWTP